MQASQRQHGFTLVELLVVITIIVLLIAMLLPALQQAREAANDMRCKGNLRQVGVATEAYHSEFHGYFPSYSYVYSAQSPVYAMFEYLNYTPASISGTGHVFYCPSSARWAVTIASGLPYPDCYFGASFGFEGGIQSYGFNTALEINKLGGTFDPTPNSTTQVERVETPSVTFWGVDAGASDIGQYGDRYIGIQAYRHGGTLPQDPTGVNRYTKPGASGFNGLFVDGHATRVIWDVFNTWAGWPSPPPYFTPNDPYAWY